jgi:hypothetical protein
MRLVDDDRKTPVAVLAADVVEDEREFLDRGDDDLLAALDETAVSSSAEAAARTSSFPVTASMARRLRNSLKSAIS